MCFSNGCPKKPGGSPRPSYSQLISFRCSCYTAGEVGSGGSGGSGVAVVAVVVAVVAAVATWVLGPGTGFYPSPKVVFTGSCESLGCLSLCRTLAGFQRGHQLKATASVWKCIPGSQFSTQDAHRVGGRTLPKPLHVFSRL